MSLVPFSLSRRSSLSRRNSLSRSSSMLDFWNRRPMLDFGPNFHDFNTIRDPFDEIDLLAGNDLMWLHRPSLIRTYVVPRQPEKYRVTVDCSGFNPNSIKTEVSGLKVIVTAREEQRQDSNNYTMRVRNIFCTVLYSLQDAYRNVLHNNACSGLKLKPVLQKSNYLMNN